jgi:DNA-binding response OmpR family regulator
MARILLVEDNGMDGDMLFRRLLWSDYEVILAGDGREPVDKATAQN